jgi:DNA-binding response OmpR family regulator
MEERKANLRILVVEDDQRMRDLLCRGLRDFGHTAMPASDGGAGLELAIVFEFDVIVLDVGLPVFDGYEVARKLRKEGKRVPVLMLTAHDAEDEIIRGLECGADDYLLKPFSFPELVARLHTLARINRKRNEVSGLALDGSRLTVTREDCVIPLTRAEFLLLAALYQEAGHVVSRQALSEAIWGEPMIGKANALDVLIHALRNKVDGPFATRRIETIRGLGYRLRLQPLPFSQAVHESGLEGLRR